MLAIILIIAGCIDICYRKIPPIIILLLFIYSVLFSPIPFVERILGFGLTVLPLLIVAIVTDKIKGGDLKFIAMLVLAIGMVRLAWLLLFTTVFAFVFSFIRNEKSIPLAFCTLIGWLIVSVIRVLT